MTSIKISSKVNLSLSEIEICPIRASGPGGQNVNKTSSAVHLRFDIQRSSLPEGYKSKLRSLKDRRINQEGIVILKAQRSRSFEKNKEDALNRLRSLIQKGAHPKKKRKATQPTKQSNEKRLKNKLKKGQAKSLRKQIQPE